MSHRLLLGPLLPTVLDVDHARDVWHGAAGQHGPESPEAMFAWANWQVTAAAMLTHGRRGGFVDSSADQEVRR